MQLIELGRGAPLIFVPGLQGRWEYARPTVEALAEHVRVLTFSLCDEPSAEAPFDPSRGFDSYGDQVVAAMDRAGVRKAVVCGLSFGGLVALNAASRFTDRIEALVLASTPGPQWHLRRRHEIYARLPWLFGPVFLVEAPFRASPEIARALPAARDRRAFAWRMARTAIRTPVSLPRMAARARSIRAYDVEGACARVSAPTLVLTGEAGLDHVVSTETTAQYAHLIAGATSVVLRDTGHQGSLTRPAAFADIVRRFAAGVHHAAA